MSKYSKLTEMCQRLGYHGICPEALEELIAIRPVVDDFMEGMREMLAPVEGPSVIKQEEEDGTGLVVARRLQISDNLRNKEISQARAIGMLINTGMTQEQAQTRVQRIVAGVQGLGTITGRFNARDPNESNPPREGPTPTETTEEPH